jgi:uncharacterized coiled-coil protein SlyX
VIFYNEITKRIITKKRRLTFENDIIENLSSEISENKGTNKKLIRKLQTLIIIITSVLITSGSLIS